MSSGEKHRTAYRRHGGGLGATHDAPKARQALLAREEDDEAWAWAWA